MGSFNLGFQSGLARDREDRLNQRQLSDEERETELNDKNSQIANIQQKMSQVGPNDPSYPTLQTQLRRVYDDRTSLFHPSQGPGAMAHLGKMLWEHVHGKPAPQQTQDMGQAASLPSVQNIATPTLPGSAGSTLPPMGGPSVRLPAQPGPVVTERPQNAADIRQRMATDLGFGAPTQPINRFQQLQKELTDSKLFTPEQISKAMEIAAGIEAKPIATQAKESWTLVPGTVNGQPTTLQQNKLDGQFRDLAGNPVSADEMKSFVPSPKVAPHVSTAALETYIRSWFPNGGNTKQREWAMLRYQRLTHPATSATRETLQFNTLTGEPSIVPLHSENRKDYGPEGPPPPNDDGTAPVVPGAADAPVSSGVLKKKASKLRSETSTGGEVTPQDDPRLAGLHHATTAQTAAAKDVLAAQKLDSLANQALASNEPVQQRQLALGLIRGMAGRVNMQEFTQYTTKMGVSNTVEGLINGITSGKMPAGIVQQLANAAHANLKAAKDAQAAVNGESVGASVDDIVNALNGKK